VTERVPAGRPAPGPVPAAVARPPLGDVARMSLAVLAVSTSGPLIAATVAPALAIAFWRNALSATVLVPFAWTRARAELAGMTGREWRLALAAGGLLGAHFATWVPSVTLTSVASSTALVTVQPVWAALLARRRGHAIPQRAWIGIVVAVAGAALITGADVTVSARALAGDGLALLGGLFAAAYITVGGEVRRSVSTTAYTTVCYATAAMSLLVVCLASGQALTGYPAASWWKILGLTVGAQFLGHSMFNVVLRTTSPTVVALAILFEAPGAALIAGLWLHQHPRALALGGLAILLLGVAGVIRSGTAVALPAE